jgi:hypothetical protein
MIPCLACTHGQIQLPSPAFEFAEHLLMSDTRDSPHQLLQKLDEELNEPLRRDFLVSVATFAPFLAPIKNPIKPT